MTDTNKIQCFFLEDTGKDNQYLRRFRSRNDDTGPEADCIVHGYHTDRVLIGGENLENPPSHDDERWPTHCLCGYKFVDIDCWQLFKESRYKRQDTGEIITLDEAPIGAMWYADYYPWKGPDGHSLMVRTPGGDWNVDSRASNCSMKDDKEHRCWVRHGEVPNITVDKNGNTCKAGGGSIGQKNFHGFLRGGYLVKC